MRGGRDIDPAALRRLRQSRGLTQHQLARIVGVAGGERISRWELGSSRPRPRMIEALAAALKVPVTDLLAGGPRLTLRGLRVAAGLSAEELAREALMSPDTYRHWEAGYLRRPPPAGELKRLANVLHVTAAEVRRALGSPE